MTIIRATVSLATLSGTPEDRAVNVWHFSDSTSVINEDNAGGIVTFLPVFYQNAALAALWSPAVSRAALVHKITVAEVVPNSQGADDDVVGKVFAESSFTISTASAVATALPSECAVALSLAGNIDGLPEESGLTRPAARRRGRLFLGPFNTQMSTTEAGTGRSMVHSANRVIIRDAYLPIVASLKTVAPSIIHSVYSPTLGQAFPVVTAWVDDAFDTIRSRGQKPTARTTFVVP